MGSCQSVSRLLGFNKQMDTFDETRTIKVSGISRYLNEVFTKYFQTKNDTALAGDVDRVFVCPEGKDCVLVEFSEDQGITIPNSSTEIKFSGTSLTVAPLHPSNTSDKDEDVSKVWNLGESPIEKGNENAGSSSGDDHGDGNKKSEKASRTRKRTSDKQQRQNQFSEHRQPHGPLMDNPKAATVVNDNGKDYSMFEDTTVKLNPGFLERVMGNPSKTKEMLGKEVKLDEEKGYLTGPWNAVSNVFKRLYSLFHGEDSALPSSSDLNCNGPHNPVISVRTFMIRYINTFHCEVFQELENVSKEIKFKMLSPDERNLEVVAKDDVSDEVFKEKYNKFINCYQKLCGSTMHQEIITLDPNISANPSIGDIVCDTRAQFNPVLVTFCQETSRITVYGQKDIALNAYNYLNDRVCAISKESMNPAGTENRHGQLTHVLSKKVTLIVYQGDITKEKTDAIVNPANEDLHHCGGAAEAISKRGGKSIQDESNDIMKKRHKLQPGDVEITTAGKLPCKFIVHAVGPRWYNHSADKCRELLQKAVRGSLNVASENDAQTIAIPAISSGVFGVPVEVCADVLFDSVEKFAKAAGDSEKLKEIRFVNIDKATTQVFEKEMRKRYGEAVSVEKAESNKNGRVISNEGKNATMGRNSNERNPSTASTVGRGRGYPKNNNSGNERGVNSWPAGEHPQPNQNASTSSTKHPPSYSDAVSKGSKNPNGNEATADASKCPICLEDITNPTILPNCGHSFCTDCISNAFKHQQKCPICSEVYGVLTGNQPPGRMTTSKSSNYLPGFQCSTIVITYEFKGGSQGNNHPHPGRRYVGITRTAYLPDNKEGKKVLRLLKKAFDQNLTFTIGRSSTTGNEGVITWNDIHHKTNLRGGATNFGYPDPTYLKRVQEELAAKGIKE